MIDSVVHPTNNLVAYDVCSFALAPVIESHVTDPKEFFALDPIKKSVARLYPLMKIYVARRQSQHAGED